jgi:hypothetical protein
MLGITQEQGLRFFCRLHASKEDGSIDQKAISIAESFEVSDNFGHLFKKIKLLHPKTL